MKHKSNGLMVAALVLVHAAYASVVKVVIGGRVLDVSDLIASRAPRN